MAAHGVVGFVGLDDLSIEIGSLLVRSGFRIKAYEVSFYSNPLIFFFSFSVCLRNRTLFLDEIRDQLIAKKWYEHLHVNCNFIYYYFLIFAFY